MTREWERVDQVFQAALDLPAGKRLQYVRECFPDEPDLVRRVEELLAAAEIESSFLDAPAALAREALEEVPGPESTTGSLDPGDVVGAFRILEVIGSGGMGTVYLAERADGHFEQRVALKLLRGGRIDESTVKRFLQERQILARLRHPNIAALFDGGLTTAGDPYLVMELVEGDGITDYSEREGLDVHQRAQLLRDVAHAADHAHQQGVIHRDLKPSNIMVTGEGRVVLLDFGIAMDADAGLTRALTQTGHRVLTLAYASPEQLKGHPVTPASDVYQLGTILYELIAGHPPLGERPDPPSSVPGRPATDLDAICARALEVAPESRYPSAAAMAEDIARFLAGRPVHAKGGGVGYRTARFLTRNRSAVGVALLLVALALSGGFLVGRGTASDAVGGGFSASGALLIGMVAVAAVALLRVMGGRGSTGLQGQESPGESEPAVEADHSSDPPTAVPSVAAAQRLDERTVAVLPFEILGGEDQTDPFAAGLHDDLVTELSRVDSLTVISRSSVSEFRGEDRSVSQIGRELGAGTVVEGTVQRAGSRVRLNVQLTDVGAGVHRWAERYDRQLTAVDIFDLQSELADRIAGTLLAQLTGGRGLEPRPQPTDDLEAYRFHAQGRGFMLHRSREKLEQAAASFEEAVQRDPGYASAWASLSTALSYLGEYEHVDGEDVFPRAERAARKAIELDADLADAHSALGDLHTAHRRVAEAVDRHARAVQLSPGLAHAHHGLCWARLVGGDVDGSIAAGRAALKLDPLDSETRTNLSIALLGRNDVDGARREIGRVRETGFESDYGRWAEGLARYHAGREMEAAATMSTLSEGWTAFWPETANAMADHRSGKPETAEALLDQLAERSDVPFFEALLYLALGKHEASLDALARSHPMGWPETLYFRYAPSSLFGPVREDSRYPSLLSQLDQSWGVLPDLA